LAKKRGTSSANFKKRERGETWLYDFSKLADLRGEPCRFTNRRRGAPPTEYGLKRTPTPRKGGKRKSSLWAERRGKEHPALTENGRASVRQAGKKNANYGANPTGTKGRKGEIRSEFEKQEKAPLHTTIKKKGAHEQMEEKKNRGRSRADHGLAGNQ